MCLSLCSCVCVGVCWCAGRECVCHSQREVHTASVHVYMCVRERAGESVSACVCVRERVQTSACVRFSKNRGYVHWNMVRLCGWLGWKVMCERGGLVCLCLCMRVYVRVCLCAR